MLWYEYLTYSSTAYWILMAILVWQIPWKGVALWRAARRDHKIWFIVFLLVNSVAVLEILYIFWWSKLGQQPKKECWLCRLWKKIFKRSA